MVLLRMRFVVPEELSTDFEREIIDNYGPALERQDGFHAWRLLKPYSAEVLTALGTSSDGFDWDLEFEFESEPARLAWVASADHTTVLEAVRSITQEIRYCGYDLVARDGGLEAAAQGASSS